MTRARGRASLPAALAVLAVVLALAAPRAAGAVVVDRGPVAAERPAAAAGAAPPAEAFRPGEILVTFRETAPAVEREEAHRRLGAAGARAIGRSRVHRVRLPPGRSVEDAVAAYAALGAVESAGPDRVVTVQAVPDDPLYPSLWGLAAIRAAPAWDLGTGSPEVVVAVVDTGVDSAHPDLAANLWVNGAEAAGTPGVDDDGNGYVDDVHGIDAIAGTGDPMDEHGHGTHVAGTIGAVGNNGAGVVGVNWAVRIMACKFIGPTGSGYVSDAIECLEYVRAMRERGVQVVATNNSWGGQGTSPPLESVIRDQVDVLFVAAAANDAADIDRTDYYPSGVRLPNVIAVAATDADDGLADFSNTGLTGVHLGAPGVGILSTMAAANVWAAPPYHWLSGTSMAAPHVSGVAALVAAADPTRDWRAVRNRILTGAVPVGSLAGKTASGRRLDAPGALTCGGAPLFAVTQYPSRTETYAVGVPTTLSAVSIECETPRGPVTVSTDQGASLELLDDGLGPDVAAGDGTFTASWAPTRAGERLTFASPLGAQTLVAPLVGIATALAADAAVGRPYSYTLPATGGLPPYAWEIEAGTLPPGLELDPATGVIAGVPRAFGRFDLPVTARDQFGASFSQTVLLFSVLGNNVARDWAVTLGSGADAWNELFGIAADGAGNAVAVGHTQAFAGGSGDWIGGLDPQGAERWATEHPGGVADHAWAVALDPAGRATVVGTTADGAGASLFVAGYDLDGSLRWSGRRAGVIEMRQPAVAVDGAGNVAVATAEVSGATERCLLLRYGPDGGLIWERSLQPGTDAASLCAFSSVAVAPDGSVCAAGIRRSAAEGLQALTVKYDAAGNELWSRVYAHAAGPTQDIARSVAADGQGNVYVGVQSFAFEARRWAGGVLKYDPGGALQWVRQYQLAHADTFEPAPLLAADAAGFVRAAGSTQINRHGGQRFNADQAYLGIYDAHGNFQGFSLYGAPTDNDRVNALALAGEEAALTAGQRCISGAGCFFDVVRYEDGFRLAPVSLDADEAGVPYHRELVALGGTPPIAWSVLGGALPPGLALDPATGVLGGTPDAPGVSDVILAATDATGAVASLAAAIRVASRLRVTTDALPPGKAFDPYEHRLAVEGGVGPWVWTLAGGSLPQGLFFDRREGTISGTPAASGSFPLVFTAVDDRGAAATRELALDVGPGVAIDITWLDPAFVGVPYDVTLAALGGEPPYSWSVTQGALPRGLALDPAAGRIAGTPVGMAFTQIEITVRDAGGLEGRRRYVFAVDRLGRHFVHTASGGEGRLYGGRTFAPLAGSSGDSRVGDRVRAFYRGRRGLLVGYRPRPYARATWVATVADDPDDNAVTFLAEHSRGTGHVTLVVVDPATRKVTRALASLRYPLRRGVPTTVRDLAGLWGLVPAGRSFGVMLSISTPRPSANSVRWGRTGGGPRHEQWFTVWEWLR